MDSCEKEALAYVSSWVARKVAQEPSVRECGECESLLVRTNDAEHNYHGLAEDDAFISKKKYTTTSRLFQPSSLLKECICKCEGVIKKIPPKAWLKKKLTARLKTLLSDSGVFADLHRIHPAHSNAIEKVALNKYVMCRMGAELRARNQASQSKKKTRHDTTAQQKLTCFTN